jgi:hypothetical protein
MEELYLHFEFYENIAPVDVLITWGIHKELSNYLLADENLFNLFTNDTISDMVINICLAERDMYGKASKPFDYINLLTTNSMIANLELVFNYFENFFFQNQLRLAKTTEKLLSVRSQNIAQ